MDWLVDVLILLGSVASVVYGGYLAGLPGMVGMSEDEARARTKEQRRLGWLLIIGGAIVFAWMAGPVDPGEVTR